MLLYDYNISVIILYYVSMYSMLYMCQSMLLCGSVNTVNPWHSILSVRNVDVLSIDDFRRYGG